MKSPIDNMTASEAIEAVLSDPGVHYFCKDIIRRGLDGDPLDSYRDVTLAAEVLRRYLEEVLQRREEEHG